MGFKADASEATEMHVLPSPGRGFDDFCDAVEDVIDRFREAETLTRAEAVGALEFIKQKIMHPPEPREQVERAICGLCDEYFTPPKCPHCGTDWS